MATSTTPDLYAVVAEFEQPAQLVAAARQAYAAGYRALNCYSPYPIEAAWEAIGHHKSPIPRICLIGGLVGATSIFSFMTWVNLVAYPQNIGGRPRFSWPAFIPPTFETAILLAGLAAAIGMFLVNGLPSPYHPMFNAKGFERASQVRYFLAIEARDPRFDRAATAQFLRGLSPLEVSEVVP